MADESMLGKLKRQIAARRLVKTLADEDAKRVARTVALGDRPRSEMQRTPQGAPYFLAEKPDVVSTRGTPITAGVADDAPVIYVPDKSRVDPGTLRHEQEHIEQFHAKRDRWEDYDYGPDMDSNYEPESWAQFMGNDWWGYRMRPSEQAAWQAGSPGPLGGFRPWELAEIAQRVARAQGLPHEETVRRFNEALRQAESRRASAPTAGLLRELKPEKK